MAKKPRIVVGVNARIPFHGIKIDVAVSGARSVFRRYELLVRPLAGAGQGWISFDKTMVQKAVRG